MIKEKSFLYLSLTEELSWLNRTAGGDRGDFVCCLCDVSEALCVFSNVSVSLFVVVLPGVTRQSQLNLNVAAD